MKLNLRHMLAAALTLSSGVMACDRDKPSSSSTRASASPAVAPPSPTASMQVWSPPQVCTTLKGCQQRCKSCSGSCTTEEAGACHQLGDLLLRDEMGQFDVTAAAQAYELACKGGHMLACSALAIQVQDGRGVKRDIGRAVELYERACNAGIGVGCYNLGLMLLHGGGGEIDEERARAYFQQAREKYQAQCEQGDLQWCMNLGVLYENGHGVARDPGRAETVYQQACAKGHGDSCVNLVLARLATTENADVASELKVLEARCNTGTVLACGVLGQMVGRGGAGVAPNPDKATTLLQRACTGGSGHACATLGAMHALGQGGVKRDPAAATRFSARACDLGLASSCMALGVEAANQRAWDKAQRYLQQACWIGDGEACARLSSLVAEGKGSKPDLERALSLLRDACRTGQGDACMQLLEREEAIPLPAQRRQRLLEAACKRGFSKACAALGL